MVALLFRLPPTAPTKHPCVLYSCPSGCTTQLSFRLSSAVQLSATAVDTPLFGRTDRQRRPTTFEAGRTVQTFSDHNDCSDGSRRGMGSSTWHPTQATIGHGWIGWVDWTYIERQRDSYTMFLSISDTMPEKKDLTTTGESQF